MRVSTKGRYALRLMVDLATHNTGESISLREVAERQEVSDKYMEQIVSLLVRAGMVYSTRGPLGGYRLSRQPEEYTVGEILRVTLGDLTPVTCRDSNNEECYRAKECPAHIFWKDYDEVIQSYVDSVTLADIIEKNSPRKTMAYQ